MKTITKDSRPQRNSWSCKFIKETRAEALKMIGTPIEALPLTEFERSFTSGSRVEYETLYMEHRRRLWHFFALALWEDDERWISELTNILDAICQESIWAFPAHVKSSDFFLTMRHTIDLFSAETAQMLAECVFLLGDKLPPRLVEAVKYNVVERVLDPYVKRTDPFHKNNWSAICNGCCAIAMFELGLYDMLDASLDKVIAGLNLFLESYNEDGACMEGAIYWRYGFGYFAYTAQMIAQYTDGRIDFFNDEKVERMASFYLYAFAEPPYTIPFSDAGHLLHLHPGMIAFLSDRYGLPMIPESSAVRSGYDLRWRCPEMVRNLIWTDKFASDGDRGDFFKYYEDAQWYINRSAGFVFAAKGGHNSEPHNHNDVGSFIFYANGEYVVDDLGWPEYDMAYFDLKKRYDYICASSLGHSVPIVDGAGQNHGVDKHAEILRVDEQGIAMDISLPYGLETGSVTRRLTFEDGVVTLEDAVSEGHELTDRIVTCVKPEIIENGVRIGHGTVISDAPVDISVTVDSFETRYSIGVIEGDRIVTAYMIDFKPHDGSKSIRLRISSSVE